MSVFSLTYDLNHEVRRPPIVKFIKDNFAWARLSESSYAIETSMSATQVRDSFMPLLDDDDQLYAVKLSGDWAGLGPVEVNNWLHSKLDTSLALAA